MSSLRRKRSELIDSTSLVCKTTRQIHTSKFIKELLEEYCWEVFDHPSDSPDLSPTNFDPFPTLGEPLRGIHSDTLDALE